MLDRRTIVGAAPAALLLSAFPARALDDEIVALERRSGGRLGVAAFDTGSGKSFGHRADERFAMCSTFKLLMSAAVLHRVDSGEEHLDRMIAYSKADILPHSPVTSAHLAEGRLSIEALCEAVVVDSDNCAANLLIASLGGPKGVTQFARRIGDTVTRLDRTEPALNYVGPGDPRDTTTPNAMLGDLKMMFLRPVLSQASSDRLTRWSKDCRTGLDRLRAGFPKDWTLGDKTGTGFHGEANDIAIVWPPGRAPILVTAYYNLWPGTDGKRNAVLAEVGRIVARRFG